MIAAFAWPGGIVCVALLFRKKLTELLPLLIVKQRELQISFGISAPGLTMRPYFNRYTEDALDRCDALSSFSAQGKATLDESDGTRGQNRWDRWLSSLAPVPRRTNQGDRQLLCGRCRQHISDMAAP